MAYAELQDVLARAGRLRGSDTAPTWTETTAPSTSDIGVYLQQASAELDARIAALGIPTPITDPIATAALAGIVADKSLRLLVTATWPGGNAPQAISDFVAALDARIAEYDKALDNSNMPALLYLATVYARDEGGASNYWTRDGQSYDYWVQWAEAWYRTFATDQYGVLAVNGPAFRRGERW